jgi:hypothetical protein
MTAVFRVSDSGSLQNLQVGIVDIITTASAATSAWGWVGGLRGLQTMLRVICLNLEDRTNVFRPPSMLAAACKILTFHGVATFQDEQAEAFGGDYTLQMVGFTLCALAHELIDQYVIDLFMRYLAPKRFRQLLEGLDGAREALYTQLVDNIHMIKNEGASKGLTEKFERAANDLHLLNTPQSANLSATLAQERNSDLQLVGGLLSWIGAESPGPYFTRSALVLRISAYLKAAGYVLGSISTWSGHGIPPTEPHAVFLVLGGSSPTDSYADSEPLFSHEGRILISHYRYSTVGSMLLNTLQRPGLVTVEALQDYFDSIEKEVSGAMVSTWTLEDDFDSHCGPNSRIVAHVKFKGDRQASSSTALRLSSFYFARCAEIVAGFYQRIAQPATLEVVKKHLDDQGSNRELDPKLVEFRVVTISIVLVIIGHFGGSDYRNLRHCISLSLEFPQKIRNLAAKVETLLVDGLSFSHIAGILGYCHAGQNPTFYDDNTDRDEVFLANTLKVIGFRNNTYAVLPALICRMAEGPCQSALGFQCFDTFIANVPVYSDCSIKSGSRDTGYTDLYGRMSKDIMALEGLGGHDDPAVLESTPPQVRFTVPSSQAPDIPLYLNIERPLEIEGPVLSICGRVHGTAIGNVGVFAVLRTIIRGLSDNDGVNRTRPCQRGRWASDPTITATQASSQSSSKCLIVPASIWSTCNKKLPGYRNVNVYVPVKHDSAWAIFLAGYAHSHICLCCIDCTMAGVLSRDERREEENVVIIGYQG